MLYAHSDKQISVSTKEKKIRNGLHKKFPFIPSYNDVFKFVSILRWSLDNGHLCHLKFHISNLNFEYTLSSLH